MLERGIGTAPSAPEASLKKRYLYKLLTNLVGLLFSFVTETIIPRGLGPRVYGDYNFLTNFFNQIIGFFEMGTSAGFYTKLSQRPGESGLVTFYLYFAGLVSIGVTAFLIISVSPPLHDQLWPAQDIFPVCLAAGFGLLMWSTQILTHMADAYGVTVSAELGRIAQKTLGLFLILLLYYFHAWSLINFFYYQYILLAFLIIALTWILRRNRQLPRAQVRLAVDTAMQYIREFYVFSHPLFLYALAGVATGVVDRWLLQKYAGSVQQGFYSLSYQIGALCFLFTSAMTPLLMREFSIAYGNRNLAKVAELFQRAIVTFYSIAAYFSCFIALQADNVVSLMGGKSYAEAALAVSIMAFYPLHQTYGQIAGSIFFATDQTRRYRNIGIFFLVIGLPVTYVLLAPARQFGFHTGAVGLAVKMVAINIISVNVLLWYTTRFLQLSFMKYVRHQLFSVSVLLMLAAAARFFTDLTLRNSGGAVIFNFLLAGIWYTICAAGFAWLSPATFGVTRGEILSALHAVRDLFGGRSKKE